jgi:zinc transport system substrate-binding protein
MPHSAGSKTLGIRLAPILAAWVLGTVSVAAAAEKMTVFVSIAPQKHFVERIAGPRVAVEVMVAPGASPATYEPRPRQMTALAAARLYLAIGVPFEAVWLDKIAAANPGMQVIRTHEGIQKRPSGGHRHQGAGHGEKGHDHGILDPHIWTAPPLVKMQAARIRDALIAVDPAGGGIYRANYERFADEIEALDAELHEIFQDRHGTAFMVFHPSWGYFAEAYGLTQIPIEIEGKSPKPAQLAELIQTARDKDIRVIFVQPQFSDTAAQAVARAIDGRVVAADPLAEDWMANLRRQARVFREALR